MVFDAARGRSVLVGLVFGLHRVETWEWDGTDWTYNPTSNRLPYLNNAAAMAYDSARARVVLWPELSPGNVVPYGLWQYPDNRPATYSAFGSGCAGSAGVPTLQPLGTSLPWLAERFTLLFTNVPPGRPIFVFVGASRTTWYGQFPLPLDLTGAGMPGCSLYVSADYLVGLAQPILNFVTWDLDFCQCPELLGVSFYNQGFVYDPPANPMGMTATNGGAGVIGIR